MEEQIAALQAESREKDALIQKLQSAAGSSGAELEVAQKRIETHSAKEERSYQELSKAVDAEVTTTKVAREKDQSLKVAREQISNLRTKFSRKKTEKEQLIAGLELALKNKGDELSASIVEKTMLLHNHKKELSKIRDNLLELELSAAEAIHFAFPSVELKDDKSSAELSEMMPAVLKDHCQFIAKMCSSAVLAKVKSHYPGLKESRLLTGYACERPEALALVEEVKATAAAMFASEAS
ncbi:hypothetical protein EJB05_08374, partial [Eragrostis curvula]